MVRSSQQRMAKRQERRVRTFRERKDVLALFDEQHIKRYCVDRAGIIFVTDLIRDIISPATSRSRAFRSLQSFAISLPPADDDDDEGEDGDPSIPGNIHPCDGAAFRQHCQPPLWVRRKIITDTLGIFFYFLF